jgi:hypothetical protein
MRDNISTYIYIYRHTARTRVLPAEVRFDFAGPAFSAFWDVGGMAERLTRFVSKTQTHKPY